MRRSRCLQSIRHLLQGSSLQQATQGIGQYCTTSTQQYGKQIGFVFDIDGVIKRGSTVINEAIIAFQYLYKEDKYKYPVCFLTNGGGTSESARAQQLSKWLGVNVSEDQVVLSHTPMKQLAHQYGDKTILIAGKGPISQIAESYQIRKSITTSELHRAIPVVAPLTADKISHQLDPTQIADKCAYHGKGYGSASDPINGVLVFHDPDDWYRDMQIIVETVMSGGVIGNKWRSSGQPMPLYFSNPDLLYASTFPSPRLGQGGFLTALMAVLQQVHEATNVQHNLYSTTYFGKPNQQPFRYVEQLLMRQHEQLSGVRIPEGAHVSSVFKTIYMVGDNPLADIAGANGAGAPWTSLLVETGVYDGAGVASLPAHAQPHHVHQHVLDAVECAIQREGS